MQSNSFVINLCRGVSTRIRSLLDNPNKKADLTWFKIKQLKHLSGGKIRGYKYKGIIIFYSSPSDFLHGLKEIFTDEIYNIKLPHTPYIIDCGANIGLSIIYLKEQHKNAEILAFEPDKNNFQLLKKNIASFNLKNVTLEESAIWINDTELSFKNDGNMGSKIELSSTADLTFVKAVQLKKFINRKVDFLKIDIEGAEYAVLKDIKENLHFVNSMFLEYHGLFSHTNELVEIFDILHGAGLSFYIKEATPIYNHPFQYALTQNLREYDVQLNIFCFRQP